VRGEAIAGPGVEAHSSAGPGVRASSDQAQGVIGEATAANAAGVFGRNDSGAGVGIDGYSQNGIAVRATASTGTALDSSTWGGTGAHVQSQTGIGIDCYSTSGPAINAMSILGEAVKATATSHGISSNVLGGTPSSPGVGIESMLFGGGDAVKATAGFEGVAIHGVGYRVLKCLAGLFDGDVTVNGILVKYASFFRIDHPLDPKRKTLTHAAVEAPEYKTFYDGVATLGKDGTAFVRMPEWFAALNGNLRFQLTPLGTPAPNLHVRGIKRGAFIIAGGAAGLKVCWQVTGVRRDEWARANPLRVEGRKPARTHHSPAATVAELRRLGEAVPESLRAARKKADAAAQVAKGRRLVVKKASPARVPASPRENAANAQQARALIKAIKSGRR
jgi:hypothetical protein